MGGESSGGTTLPVVGGHGGRTLGSSRLKNVFFIFKADEWSAIPGELRGGLNGLGMGIACVC